MNIAKSERQTHSDFSDSSKRKTPIKQIGAAKIHWAFIVRLKNQLFYAKLIALNAPEITMLVAIKNKNQMNGIQTVSIIAIISGSLV